MTDELSKTTLLRWGDRPQDNDSFRPFRFANHRPA